MPSASAKSQKEKRALPWIEPLRLVRKQDAFDDPNWLFELKYDGFRALLYIEDGDARFMSRNSKHMRRFDELAETIAEGLEVRDAILDGELVCLDQAGRPQFNELFFRRGTPYFVAFDLLWLNEKDLRSLALLRRKARLKSVIAAKPGIGYVAHYPAIGKPLFESVQRLDLEGVVAKKMNSPYGAGTTWYKIKNPNYSQAEGRHNLFEKSRTQA
jgi:bifunctional non-homologous end joining protein LigD